MLRDVALHRFEEGYTSKSDLLQVESRLLDAEYLLSEAEQSWSVALHNFNVLRGAEPDTDIELSFWVGNLVNSHCFQRIPVFIAWASFQFTIFKINGSM